jgi:D-alanyl-D-alanine carboxypeptidase
MIPLALLVCAVHPQVDSALALIGEPGCPKLYPALSAPFQKAVPAESWPKWCASVGQLSALEEGGVKDGWFLVRGRSSTGLWRLEVAFDSSGRISGLRATPEKSALAAPPAASLEDELLQVQKEHHLPALAALVLRRGHSSVMAAVGVRKLGDPTPVGLDDKWHLGSDTKAMTATLAALLVEGRNLKWTSTVTELLPEWKDIHPDFAKVTLEMLLGHRGGLPDNISEETWKAVKAADPQVERSAAVHAQLRRPPTHSGEYLYSNAGYMVAGVMLEKAAGMSWELAMKKRLFEPLGMGSCGFGPPASSGKVDQPWAHLKKDGSLIAVEPGPASDNPLGLGPAGTVHCSLTDWARFVELHLKGALGEKTIVSPESIARLQTAASGGQYALGWLAVETPWSRGKALSHDGSNTMFYASVWVVPSRNLAFLVTTNAGEDEAQRAVQEVVAFLAERTK